MIKYVNGEPIEMTEEEIAQREAEEAANPPGPALEDALGEIFDGLPISQQIIFAGPMALVERKLKRGLVDQAKSVIVETPIPAELSETAEPIRASFLALFPD